MITRPWSSTTSRRISSRRIRWSCCGVSLLERGGSFLMLGGKDSFQQGKFDRTPIAALLPIYLNPSEAFAASTQTLELRMNLTREGWLQPWVRLRDNEQDERLRLSEMPNFRVFNQTGSPKAGARVLAARRQ